MFFWMILASLMGVIAFGNLHDKVKDQDDHVSPVYEAVALSMQAQHNAAVGGYMDAQRTSPETMNTFLASFTDGIGQLAAVVPSGAASTPTWEGGALLPYVRQRLPSTYKPQNGTRSYFFCMPRNQNVGETVNCNDANIVKYIVTIRQMPRKNDTSEKTSILKAIGKATHYSRTVGMLAGTATPLASADGGQPLGSHFYVMAGGYSAARPLYIPDHIVCNFPLSNNRVLGDSNGFTYIVAITYLNGLATGQNLDDPGGSPLCPAAAAGM